MEITDLLTDLNPINAIVDADVNSAPHEDAACIGSAGATYLLTTSTREFAFRNIKTIAECLADELINAAKGSSNSQSVMLLKRRMRLKESARSNVEALIEEHFISTRWAACMTACVYFTIIYLFNFEYERYFFFLFCSHEDESGIN
ncbi:putative ribosomal protein S5/S7 [Rosa chinensis]|uniref:Putative ribosomal protein S5/S7 n=1 Tax=Rosa chinensis TaxID=74649 RepID=A0A2P6PG79_ROSCH|nr:putative ribosomal protein S5/S7 [Rosa chinensis]